MFNEALANYEQFLKTHHAGIEQAENSARLLVLLLINGEREVLSEAGKILSRLF